MQPAGYGAAKYETQGSGSAVSHLSLLFLISLLKGYAEFQMVAKENREGK